MKDTNRFRQINQIERNTINKSLSQISTEFCSILEDKEHNLYIAIKLHDMKDNFPSVYLVPSRLTKIINRIQKVTIINSAGLFFGFIKKGQFYISIEAIEFLNIFYHFTAGQEVIVNQDGEKSVLYGNKISKMMISEIDPNIKKGDLIFIFNISRELIAIGKSQIFYSEFQDLDSNEKVALNLIDKGYYLRKQKKKI